MAESGAWYGGFFDDTKDVFSQLAGTYLEYERIQQQADASGAAQSEVNQLPENAQQVQAGAVSTPTQWVNGVDNSVLLMGAAALGLVVFMVVK